jgi:hypothetical protein
MGITLPHFPVSAAVSSTGAERFGPALVMDAADGCAR